jgi:hypothetical protein
VNRHRFSKRALELNDHAQFLENLVRIGAISYMPDHATEKDLRQAADLMRGAAIHLEELVSATPTGCICRHIENDNYSYLDYAEACLHHRQLYVLRESLKKDYAKMEKALKNEARMKLVAAALSGSAAVFVDDDILVQRAIVIADATIRRITEAA